jgi:hypothetical protein
MADEIKFEIKQSKLFTKKAILVINAYIVLGVSPIVTVSFLVPLIFNFLNPAIAFSLSLVAFGLAVGLCLYFFPIGAGNPHVRKLVRSLNVSTKGGYIIQLTIIPRLKSGFWTFLEDADDVGLLAITENQLVFNGDSVEFSFPYTQIKNIQKKNIGWRGAWICGNRIQIDFLDSTGKKSFEFTERSSLSVLASRQISAKLFNFLSAKIQK